MAHSKPVEIIEKIGQMHQKVKTIRQAGSTIGLVPTMGYFHEGHISLMRAAREETGCVVVSLFVNPIQFGPFEDFYQYPRDMERDIKLAEQAGVGIIFSPRMEDMYPRGFLTYVKVETLSDVLCGSSRTGHFQGVTTVVSKLFNIVKPDIAFFGQKDAQQAIIIQKMVTDLNFGITIRILPIVREEDGLAMSSRNGYLSEKERKAALCLYEAIQKVESMVKEGILDTNHLIAQSEAIINAEPLANLEYISICHLDHLSPLAKITDKALMALAVQIGKTRLIDNTILEV